jgi:hypothetical protein
MRRNPVSGRIRQILCAVVLVLAGGLLLASSALAAPANDDFASAQELYDLGNSVYGVFDDNTAATLESGEPQHGGVPGGASVWYRWTAPATDTANLYICNATFDSQLAVYTGTAVSALTPVPVVGNNYGWTCAGAPAISIPVAQGTSYAIAVDGVGGAHGTFDLTLNVPRHPTCCAPPAPPPPPYAQIKRIRVNSDKRTATAFFTTDLAGVSFICQIDQGKRYPCKSPVTLGKRKPWAKLSTGKHQLTVVDASSRPQQPDHAQFSIKAL